MLVRPSSALIPRCHLKAGRVQAAEWCLSREWREKPSLLAMIGPTVFFVRYVAVFWV